MLKTASYKYIL